MPLPPPTAPTTRCVGACGRSTRPRLTTTPMRGTTAKSNGMCDIAESWRWTSEGSRGFVSVMDEEFITALCARIGMIMEDASVIALTIGGLGETQRHVAISDIAGASERIAALVNAVRALERLDP